MEKVLNCKTLMCAYPGCSATSAETKIIKACSEMTQEILLHFVQTVVLNLNMALHLADIALMPP